MTDRHPLLKFGIFGLVCLAFTAWLIATIGNISFADRTGYQAEFADVSGLLVNDAVKISGVTVGKVTGLDVVPGGTARVSFAVDDDVTLTEDTLVSVRWRDVLGLRFLYLQPGDGAEVAGGHDFPLAQTDSPADLGLLLNRLVPVMSALRPELQNQVLEALSEGIVGREAEIRELISDGAELTRTIASRDEEIRRLLDNSVTLLRAYNQREEDLQGFIDSFAEVAETLEARNDTLERTLTQLTGAQAELGDLVDRNDEQLRGALDAAEELAGVLSANRDNLEEVLETGGDLAAYHYISRLGQWFNINAVGVSVDEQTVSTTKGARLPGPQGDAGTSGSTSGLRGFLGPASGPADGRAGGGG